MRAWLVYQSAMLWLILAYVLTNRYGAYGAFLIAMAHGLVLMAIPFLKWFAQDDEEFQGLPRRTESGN